MDVLELKFMEYHELSQKDKSLQVFRAGSVSGLTDAESVIKRCADYIHLSTHENKPVSMQELSRRFARTAIKFGTTMHDVVGALIQRELIDSFSRANRTLFLSHAALIERREGLGDDYEGMIDQVLGNVQ